MEFARISARGQTTIPKRIREAANLREGDMLAFDLQDDHLVVKRVTPHADGYLEGLTSVMHEWAESEDEEAWRDL